jgi:hypothetical protein
MRLSYRLRLTIALLAAVLGLTLAPALRVAGAGDELPPLVFVARAHLATRDFIFGGDLGPAGQLSTGLNKFAPGSKLLVRNPNGSLRTLIDTSLANPPLGLRDVQSPDVSFDGTRIIFAGTTGPTMYKGRSYARPFYSWRIYEIGVDGSNLRRLSPDRPPITIPYLAQEDIYANEEHYGHYDDLFPAYLADGRIVFSSTRMPARAHYDIRPVFNLYVMNGNGSGLHRITTERGGALHPTPLPDGRILWSRWWVNFNQPSEQGIYNRIDNKAGTEPALDENGDPVLDGNGQPITGYRLPDNTLVYSNTEATFNPAKGRLPGGAEIRSAPNTWHLMTVSTDGGEMRRYAWTPRYDYHMDEDSGNDTYNAAQPTLVISGGATLVAYTTQRDGTMVHSTFNTGIRVAWPGAENIHRNITESIAGYRWGNYDQPAPPYALHPAGLPDGRILFSETVDYPGAPASGTYSFTQDGKSLTLPLQGSQLRYTLRTIRPDGTQSAAVTLTSGIGSADAMDAKPIVVRPVGSGPGQWHAQVDQFTAPISDDPLLGNIPNDRGLKTADGQPAYPWSQRTSQQVAYTTIHNPSVYANPPLSLPHVNNSPPIGSVAFADVYIDANQFTGAKYNATTPDDQVRAIKWTRVPVDEQGAFTAQVPADTPAFIVLRDKNGNVVRGGNRSSIAIAQGNGPGRPGQRVTCVGCHMGHVSGSVDSLPLDPLGWTNIAPSAVVTATSEWSNDGNQYYHGRVSHLTDRHNYVPEPGATAGGPYTDEDQPWIADVKGPGQRVQLDWKIDEVALPVAILEVRLVGAEPGIGSFNGPEGFSSNYRVSGVLRFYLAGQQVATQTVGPVAPLWQGGTVVHLAEPVRADRLVFEITAIAGKRYGGAPPAALSEVEVIGRSALTGLPRSPTQVRLPMIAR